MAVFNQFGELQTRQYLYVKCLNTKMKPKTKYINEKKIDKDEANEVYGGAMWGKRERSKKQQKKQQKSLQNSYTDNLSINMVRAPRRLATFQMKHTHMYTHLYRQYTYTYQMRMYYTNAHVRTESVERPPRSPGADS